MTTTTQATVRITAEIERRLDTGVFSSQGETDTDPDEVRELLTNCVVTRNTLAGPTVEVRAWGVPILQLGDGTVANTLGFNFHGLPLDVGYADHPGDIVDEIEKVLSPIGCPPVTTEIKRWRLGVRA